MKKTLAYTVPQSDLRWDYFRAGGNGGQKQNKTSSACRVTHLPSGIACESRTQRQQIQNRRVALQKLAEHPRFKLWCRMHVAANQEGFASVAQRVEESMTEANLIVETAAECKPDEAHCDKNG